MGYDNSLNELYELYFDDVYHYLLYFTNSRTDAEDLTQDTFIKVFKHYDKFKHQSSVKTWIFSIARHIAIDHYRKKKAISVLPEFLTNIKASSDNLPEKVIEEMDEWEQLQIALLKLKPDYRNVIILRGLKELSIKETAEVLNWKESKVKVAYHRALKEMKQFVHRTEEGGWIINE
jgi:RNA polymerase sigma-70 factor, ECF subfamily